MIKLVKAIIINDNKVLLLRRRPSSTFFASMWDFPGGKIEPNENPVDALHREVDEETTLKIEFDDECKDCFYNEHNTDLYFRVYKIKEFSGDIVLSKDHTEYEWIKLDTLKDRNIAPVVRLALLE